MKNFIKMSLILGLICILAAGSLAYVYSITKPKIEQYKREALLDSLKLVIPGAVKFDETIADKKWTGYDSNGTAVGVAIKTMATGYGGPIQILFGMNNEKKITKIIIIDQNETPGLGTKIKTEGFLNQYEGKSQDEVVLKKDDPQNGQIDAITAATISSRAVTNAINKSMQE